MAKKDFYFELKMKKGSRLGGNASKVKVIFDGVKLDEDDADDQAEELAYKFKHDICDNCYEMGWPHPKE